MADAAEVTTSSPTELLATGRRHLAVRDYTAAAEALSAACEQLAQEHGEQGDQCGEAYLWYGKALLGLSREESGVLGDAVPGTNTEDGDDKEQDGENGEEQNGEAEAKKVEESKHFSILPIGVLSEEAGEARNKEFRNVREYHSRKIGRIQSNEDILYNFLISSDPYITHLRPKFRKSTKFEMLEEALELLDHEDIENEEDEKEIMPLDTEEIQDPLM